MTSEGGTIIAGIRPGAAKSNRKVAHFAKHIGARLESRNVDPKCDLYVQWGSKPSIALKAHMEAGKPYIILENPIWGERANVYTWGYNGLNGRSWAPLVGSRPVRPHPPLESPRDSGGVPIIFGQLPGDRALEGIDYDRWLANKQLQYPEAEYRPHPAVATVPESIEDALGRCSRAICYSSTVASQAVIAGIPTEIDSDISWAWPVYIGLETREEWIKRMAYRHCYILEEAGCPDRDWILSALSDSIRPD